MSKVYLASPFFSWGQTLRMENVLNVLRSSGYDVYAPYEMKIDGGDTLSNEVWAKRVYDKDIEELLSSDYVVAIAEGMNADAGTMFEVGYAVAMGKKVYLVIDSSKEQSLMTVNGATGIIEYSKMIEYHGTFNLCVPRYLNCKLEQS